MQIDNFNAEELDNAENNHSSEFNTDNVKTDSEKIDARRKLEDYLEQKRLEKELKDY